MNLGQHKACGFFLSFLSVRTTCHFTGTEPCLGRLVTALTFFCWGSRPLENCHPRQRVPGTKDLWIDEYVCKNCKVWMTYHLLENNYSFDALQAYCFRINM